MRSMGCAATLFGVETLAVWLDLGVLALFVALCSWFGLRSFRHILEPQ